MVNFEVAYNSYSRSFRFLFSAGSVFGRHRRSYDVMPSSCSASQSIALTFCACEDAKAIDTFVLRLVNDDVTFVIHVTPIFGEEKQSSSTYYRLLQYEL